MIVSNQVIRNYKSNTGGGSGSSGGSPRYDLEGNVLGSSGKQSYTYDGTNPPNLAGKILKNQFIQIGTNIYYLDSNGIMVTGQHTINGKAYNFETGVGATEGRFLY